MVFSECKNSIRLPIKGGARARVKGFTTFEARAVFRTFFVSSSFANCTLNLVFLCSYILVFADSLRLFGPPNNGFYDMVANIWQSESFGSTPLEHWQFKICRLRQHLRGWARHIAGSYGKEKKTLLSLLDNLDKKVETN
jgi:hypothetical protein